MDFTLKIVFHGLIVFVPVNRDDEVVDPVVEAPDHVWALLVDARAAGKERDADGHAFDNHCGALRFDLGSWTPGRSIDDFGLLPNGDQDSTAVVWLEREQIVIDPSSTSPLTVITGKRLKIGGKLKDRPCCTTADGVCDADADMDRVCIGSAPDAPEQMRDFSWLISLSEVLENPSTTPPTKPVLDLSSPNILAKIRLDRGTLESLALGGERPSPKQNRYENAHLVEFSPSPSSTWRLIWSNRAATQTMVLTMPARDRVTFRSTPLGGGTAAAPLVLEPPPHCGSTHCDLLVEVMNSPSPEILERWQSHPHSSRRHFELFWKLTSNPPVPRPAPKFVTPPPTGDLLCPEARP